MSHFARWIFGFALVLSAHASIPGWTPAAFAASAQQKKCKAKSHHHVKVAAAKPAHRSGGGAGAQMRRSPDVQILSFGP